MRRILSMVYCCVVFVLLVLLGTGCTLLNIEKVEMFPNVHLGNPMPPYPPTLGETARVMVEPPLPDPLITVDMEDAFREVMELVAPPPKGVRE